MIYFAVTREHTENWDRNRSLREQEQWDEHAAFMDALVGDGFIILGGPLEDGEHVLLIFKAESKQAIEARLAHDPWTTINLLRTTSIERWQILLRA